MDPSIRCSIVISLVDLHKVTIQESQFHVVIYCPDSHIRYDGNTPYEHGVGGGVSVRIRLANALSRTGSRVTMIGNMHEPAVIRGVHYVPLGSASKIDCDVLIGTTSGDELDLTSINTLDFDARLVITWVHGIDRPKGITAMSQDYIYCVSNFIAGTVRSSWDIPESKLFVSYNPFEEGLFRSAEMEGISRDPFRLVYFSHPSKGLRAAVEVLQILREREPRFRLDVYGGYQLWGEDEAAIEEEQGLIYAGLIGQSELARRLLGCSYCLNLQERLEPGALVTFEAMRAGCINLASPVGSFNEYIQDGRDGLLVYGEPTIPSTHRRAADLIFELTKNEPWSNYLRRNAKSVIWDTDTVAKTWTDHWRWLLDRERSHIAREIARGFPCQSCGGSLLGLSDGYHCTECGEYQRRRTPVAVNEEFPLETERDQNLESVDGC